MTATVTPLRPPPAPAADLARDAHEQAQAYTRDAEQAAHDAGEAYRAHLVGLAELATTPPARRDRYARQADALEQELRSVAFMRQRNPS